MREQLEMMERQFAHTHQDFYQVSKDKALLDQQISDFKSNNDWVLENLEQEVNALNNELEKAKEDLHRVKGTHTSGFNISNSNFAPQSEDQDHVKR